MCVCVCVCEYMFGTPARVTLLQMYEDHVINVTMEEIQCEVLITDTSGMYGNKISLIYLMLLGLDDYDHTRPTLYGRTDIFILCFSVVDLDSFEKIQSKVKFGMKYEY